MSSTKRQTGRKPGARNKGYWYRDGRGWYVTEGRKSLPLRDENGNHLQDRDIPDKTLRAAFAVYLVQRGHDPQAQTATSDRMLADVCQHYLSHVTRNNRQSTYTTRADFLFNLCTGYPAKFRPKEGHKPPKPKPSDEIHPGYETRAVETLTPHDVDAWLNAHETWGPGTRRVAVQAIKRCLNWALDRKLISSNPIRGYKAGRGRTRVTYFTPEIEQAIYQHASKPLALAIRVCIRTGVRYGSEFCQLTARHVEETPHGMVWRFSESESKNGRPRIVYVASEIAEIVRAQMKDYPNGEKLFRNKSGGPWNKRALRSAFLLLKKRLARNGIKLATDDCMYTCRHTFAKRTLNGYWTGQPCTIEQLAQLMGNSRQVCWEHYAGWCESYTDPLWAAINGASTPK